MLFFLYKKNVLQKSLFSQSGRGFHEHYNRLLSLSQIYIKVEEMLFKDY